MASYFKINFAEPGKSLSEEASKASREKIQRIFRMKMGVSLSLLIIFFVFMVSGGIFYVSAIYLPMERELEDIKKNLKKLEMTYKVKHSARQENAKKVQNALKIIDELNDAKKKKFNWSDRLKVLNSALVKDLWLSSLDITDLNLYPDAENTGPPPGKAKAQGRNKRRGHGRKKRGHAKKKADTEKAEGKETTKEKAKKTENRYKITVRGATYANPAKKPLKKIARFMTNLIDEPYWGDYFFLKDWTIDSTESIIKFEVILESKTL
jgi:hypothetical protein